MNSRPGNRVVRTTSTTASLQRPSAQLVRGDLELVVCGALGFAVVVASLLILVGVRTAQIKVGYRVHDLQTEMVKLKQERASLDVERASLLRPARLAELSRTTLGLVPVDAAHLLSLEVMQ